MKHISATDLYSYIQCPHRIWRETHDDTTLKDPPNEFVQLLWQQGVQYEQKLIDQQKAEGSILDLSTIPIDERFGQTIKAMQDKIPCIYQGYLQIDDLVGKPDLLELQGNGEYIPIDIKSAMGSKDSGSDEEEPKLKKTYAIQLSLYVDVLLRLGFSRTKIGKIWDSKGQIVEYNLEASQGKINKQTWWELYQEVLLRTRDILNKRLITEAALGSICKMCEWYRDCKTSCINRNDISLIHELGRSRKSDFSQIAKTVEELASIKTENYVDAKGKTSFKGIGEKTLTKMHRRAKLLASKGKEPIILEKYTLPDKPVELFFDIETDPTQDMVYLHGVVERKNGKQKFYAFVAEEVSGEKERECWAQFWQYIHTLDHIDYAVYYYSKYERTQYRILSQKYPDVASLTEIEAFFDKSRAIDLYYDIVLKCTDWPTHNYSVKTLAQHLGFKWRDENPSGAASIQWFNEYCRTKDQRILKRILDYNEDDCIAMAVLKDKLQTFI